MDSNRIFIYHLSIDNLFISFQWLTFGSIIRGHKSSDAFFVFDELVAIHGSYIYYKHADKRQNSWKSSHRWTITYLHVLNSIVTRFSQTFTTIKFVTSTALFLFLTRSTTCTPFIERGRLSDFTKSVVWTDNDILSYEEKQFLLGHCYYIMKYRRVENHDNIFLLSWGWSLIRTG